MSQFAVEDDTDDDQDVVDDCEEDDGDQDNALQNQHNHAWEPIIAHRNHISSKVYILLLYNFYYNPC